jgi:hypothetical protein
MPVKTTTHTHKKRNPDEGGFSHISICFEPYQASPISQLLSPPHTHTLTQTKYNVETPNLPVRNLQTSGTHNNK